MEDVGRVDIAHVDQSTIEESVKFEHCEVARGSRLSPSWLSGWEMTAVMSRASRRGIIVTCCLPSLAARAGTPARGATVPGTSWRRSALPWLDAGSGTLRGSSAGTRKAADRDTPP